MKYSDDETLTNVYLECVFISQLEKISRIERTDAVLFLFVHWYTIE